MQWDDVDALLDVFDDPVVMAAFSADPFDREKMKSWVRRNLEHQDRFGYGLFSVILKDTGLLIGDCGLEQMELGGESVAELGYDVRSDHWGRGLATEAATAVRDYAFRDLQLPRLVSLIRRGNHRSRRVAEKIGMRLVEEDVYGDQRYWLYALDRAEAPGRNAYESSRG
jgi:RimJ/RimL family protein N-acetyltransferase